MARTAYEEALLSGSTEDDTLGSISNIFSRTPSYIVAADTMNTANNNESFLASAISGVDNIQKFIGVSLISGANQLYNVLPSVGNLLGGDYEMSDAGDVIAALDSDYAKFYEENRDSADLVGFMVSSLVPGIGGVKMLKAGQASLQSMAAGKYGSNMGKAIGLLAPNRQKLVNKAKAEVLNNTAPATLSNAAAQKAIAAGFGQNALEAVAFEVAVSATLHNSPVLENQDMGDFFTNVMWGAGVFGIAAGAIDAAKINSQLKRAADSAALEAREYTYRPAFGSKTPADQKIVLTMDSSRNLPKVPKGLDPSREAFINAERNSTLAKQRNDIRKGFGEISKGDQSVADVLEGMLVGTDEITQMTSILGLKSASRMGVTSAEAAGISSLEKKIASGIDIDDPKLLEFLEGGYSMAYLKVYGDDMGRVYEGSARPEITRLVDTLGADESLKVTRAGVKGAAKNYGTKELNLRYNTGDSAGKKSIPTFDVLKTDSVLDADARYLWAETLDLMGTLKKDTSKLRIQENDIPLLEKLFHENPNALDDPRIVITSAGEGSDPQQLARSLGLRQFIANQKEYLAVKMAEQDALAKNPRSQEAIASMLNIRVKALSGILDDTSVGKFSDNDLFARRAYAEDYTNMLKQHGQLADDAPVVDITNTPHHIRMVYDTNGLPNGRDIDNHWVENWTQTKELQRVYARDTNRAAGTVLGEFDALYDDISEEAIKTQALPSGAGAGLFASASHNYGTLASIFENMGNVTTRVIGARKEATRDILNGPAQNLLRKPEAAIEFSVLNNQMRNLPGEYALDETGTFLEPVVLKRYKQKLAEAAENGTEAPQKPTLAAEDIPLRIDIEHPETLEMIKAHIERNGIRTEGHVTLQAAKGVQTNRAPDAFYGVPVDPRDYPYFAIVIDESVTGTGHSRTLYSTNAQDLQQQIAKFESQPHLKVLRKTEAEDYYRARGQWEYEKTINSNYLNTEAYRKGVSASALPATDPEKIVSDLLSWHMTRETGLVREAVTTKYDVQFQELRQLGEDLTATALSKTSDASLARFGGEKVKNPFEDYIKTGLAISKQETYPWWITTNRLADEAVSRVLNAATALVETGKQSDLQDVNRMLKQAGWQGATYDESMQLFANARASRGVLSTTVQKANSILATVVLRLDALNAINNAVSANVLLGAETKAILRAIETGGDEAKATVGKLAYINVPGTGGQKMLSPTKLISNSLKRFHEEGRDGATMQFYRQNGFITSITDQYRDALDDLTFRGEESVGSAWGPRVDKLHNSLVELGNRGERWTGNRLAEEFNRFIAADVMKQMSDVAVERGLMSAKEQIAYINTFVNRTQGNYLSSQRPVLFQGPIGQALGLFQTYQFNLMQQLLRYAGEGPAKDWATLLALQGTIHGMNGLPAFNAINTHIIGNASGNTAHRDAYDAAYGILGKEAGDWLVYGVASNMFGMIHPDLKVNLYTRGDLNPRHLTVVPTNPADIPFVQASAKFFGNMYRTAKTLGAGGDVAGTLIQGLEHNGISRPLAGLAQTFEALNNPNRASYSTSKKGNVVAANDFLSLANLSRMVGGKPLDEAIAIDASFRFKAYGLKDARRRQMLGRAIKTTMLAGKNPTQEQIEDFTQAYVEAGGRQEEFARWFTQLYKEANSSQANELQRSLSSPFTQSMQRIMGGRELRDFTNFEEE